MTPRDETTCCMRCESPGNSRSTAVMTAASMPNERAASAAAQALSTLCPPRILSSAVGSARPLTVSTMTPSTTPTPWSLPAAARPKKRGTAGVRWASKASRQSASPAGKMAKSAAPWRSKMRALAAT